ncbi:phosphatase PAP2 family protein [Rhizobium sp. Root1220]|uniref:phosphatase PAP2 family protein n=1 Tax=Rhizobium sp. Root1220 TaxID=1736432 RepID=UPI0006F6105A|nr:phosphatase PAP2 family protein [Rhizobium sp. Root1220]KQV73057.1 phosphatidic acid phosphatase [Rhizobium sp. Root1220]
MHETIDPKPNVWSRLRKRYDARRTLHRRVPWMAFTLSAINIVAIAFFVLDRPLGQAANSLAPPLVSIAGDVTDIGRLAWILAALCTVLITGYLVHRRLWKVRSQFRMVYLGQMVAYVGLSVALASVVANILKFAIGRARPLLYDQEGIFSFAPFNWDFLHQSFPSGHSTNIGALFMALALLFPRFRLVFIGIGLWLGATRVIIGVHYPSDVAAGLALGVWFAFAISILLARFGILFSVGRDGWPTPRLSRLF